jgi:hypothetical protein
MDARPLERALVGLDMGSRLLVLGAAQAGLVGRQE